MGMTFLQQQNFLSSLLGDANTTSEDQWALADRKFHINRGELKFAKESKSLLAYATGTVSSQTISLPSGFLGIHVFVLDDNLMTGKNEMALHDYEKFVNSGEDKFWFWANASGTRQIHFVDSVSNSKTYKIWYYKKPVTDLSGDSDESPFEDEFRESSVYYAASVLLGQVGRTEMAEYYLQKFMQIAADARRDTEKLVLSHIAAFPFVADHFQFDQNVQGIGSID